MERVRRLARLALLALAGLLYVWFAAVRLRPGVRRRKRARRREIVTKS